MDGKPIGLDTRDVDTASGPVSFVKLEKNADWLLKVTTGNSGRGALRRATIFDLLAKRLEDTVKKQSHAGPLNALRARENQVSARARARAPPQSRSLRSLLFATP